MVENVIRNIGGVGSFGVFSICLFFLFFMGMSLWALRLKKTYLASMSGLPLDGDSTVENKKTTKKALLERSHE
jgi:hypothetical protein